MCITMLMNNAAPITTHVNSEWHVRGPRVQQYLLYSNINLNITVPVIKPCWDLAVIFCESIKSISSHLGHALPRTHVKAS